MQQAPNSDNCNQEQYQLDKQVLKAHFSNFNRSAAVEDPFDKINTPLEGEVGEPSN